MEESNYQKEMVESARQRIQNFAKSNGLSYQEAHDREIRHLQALNAQEDRVTYVYAEALRSLEREGFCSESAGGAWPVFRTTLKDRIGNEATETIDRESEEILKHLADSREEGLKRKGLVVGYVQSGKTANYSAVIARAVDEGYRLVIVMTGILEELRSQTQSRLQEDVVRAINKIKKNILSLTYVDSDLLSDDPNNLISNLRAENGVVYAVVKKNYKCLDNLLSQLNVASQEGLLEGVPVLIIDDESDQATPNTADKEEEYSRINGCMRQIWNYVRQGSYVAYTATPFANVLMHPHEEECSSKSIDSENLGERGGKKLERYPGLYPSDFIYVLGCPKGYIGASHFFGATGENADGMSVDAVREITEEEVRKLRPPTKKEERAGEKYKPEMVSSLEDAVCWFVIATALRRYRTRKEQHSSMLVHLSQLTESHFEVGKVIKEYLSNLQHSCNKGKIKKNIGNRMQYLYEYEVNRMRNVYRGEDYYPQWSVLMPVVAQVICETECIVRNSKSGENLDYGNNQRTTIVIGGNALSRGLTLEGLISSYFIRGGKTYDALLQMGRWFGFRPGYEDLVRLWTTKEIEQCYRYLVEVEDDTRKKMREIEDPSKIAVEIRADSKKLNVTSQNKMRNARLVNNNYSGKVYQVTVFEERNENILNNNIKALESLIKSIGGAQKAIRENNKGSYLFEGVSVDNIVEYLKNYEVHSLNPGIDSDRLSRLDSNRLVEWITDNVRQNWNVVIYSNTKENKLPEFIAGCEIRMADRSALRASSTEGVVNIKGLVNPDTYRSDLRILACHEKIEISENELKNKSGSKFRSQNGNFPLLAVYVINPKSKATKHNRRDLNASAPVVLHAIMLPEIVADTKKNVSVHHLMRGKVEPEEEE